MRRRIVVDLYTVTHSDDRYFFLINLGDLIILKNVVGC